MALSDLYAQMKLLQAIKQQWIHEISTNTQMTQDAIQQEIKRIIELEVSQ